MRRILLAAAGVLGLVAIALGPGRVAAGEASWDYAVDLNGDLYEVDCEQLAWRRVGRVEVQGKDGSVEAPDLYDLAATADGYLYGISADTLYLINISKPEDSIRIGSTGLERIYGMGVGNKGELIVNTLGGEVYLVDRKTARATLVGAMGGGLRASGDIALLVTATHAGEKPGPVIVSSCKDRSLREHMAVLDMTTGRAADQGLCLDENGAAVTSIFGLIVRKGLLYGLTNEGWIVRVDPFSGKCTRLKQTGICWWGATEYQRL
jgi:hypothetical protein